MKRDMDLVRQIVLAMEDAPTGFVQQVDIDGYSKEEIGYHVFIMMDGGLLTGNDNTSHASPGPTATPLNLTWAGHEFAAASRDESRWGRAMEIVGTQAETVTIAVLGDLLSSMASEDLASSEGWKPTLSQVREATEFVVRGQRDSATGVRFNTTLAGGAIALSASSLASFPQQALWVMATAWGFLIVSMIAGLSYTKGLPKQRNTIMKAFSKGDLNLKTGWFEAFRNGAHHWGLVVGLLLLAAAGMIAALR